MTFRVNTTALRGLPINLDRRRADLLAADRYVSGHTGLTVGGGMLTPNLSRHQAIVASVRGYLINAANFYAGGDADRVRQIVDGYTHSDTRAAARADATLPSWTDQVPSPAPVISGARPPGPELFDDVSVPSFDLVTPADHDGEIPYVPTWADLLDPGSILRDAIYEITVLGTNAGLISHPVDAFTEIAEPFIGDWAGLLRVAEVFDNVAQMLVDTGAEIARAEAYVAMVWAGRAADGCRAGLIHFTNGLHEGVVRLKYIAGVYRAVALGVNHDAQLVAALLTKVIDLLVAAVTEGASVGISGPYAIAGNIYADVQHVKQLIRLVGDAAEIVHNGFHFTDDTAHRLGILTDVGCMPDMTQPLPVPQAQIIRTPLAHV